MKTKKKLPTILFLTTGSGTFLPNVVSEIGSKANLRVVTTSINSQCMGMARGLGLEYHAMSDMRAHKFKEVLDFFKPDFTALIDWHRELPDAGFDQRRTIRVHPAHIPRFDGPGMFGYHLQKEVRRSYKEGRIQRSEISIHFIEGPVFFQNPVMIKDHDTTDSLSQKIEKTQYFYQRYWTAW